VVLKSGETHIVDPEGNCWLHVGGVPGLATCGSGDVLAGVIGGLLARGADLVTAAVWGVYLHAEAGRRLSNEVGPLGFLAREILGQIPRTLQEA
jgi:NAD(P)H-hydrate repair Nnr-like enzyme with NAD(P)H-hydrate dehydratase domain